VATKERLKLVVLYDGNHNEYSVSAHNASPEQAQDAVARWNRHLRAGYSLIAIDQSRRHKATDPRDCRTCRKTVARSSNLSPKPKFVRREQEEYK
jgi:hypothetical protein